MEGQRRRGDGPFRESRLTGELRSEEHTSELQSQSNLVCRLLLEKKNSAILDHLFTEYPLIERIGAAANSAFKTIELQFPSNVDPSAVKGKLDRHCFTMLNINPPH